MAAPSSEIEGRMTAGLRRTTLDATHSPERRSGEVNSDAAIGPQSSAGRNTKNAGHKMIGKSVSEFLVGILLMGCFVSRFVPLAKQNRQKYPEAEREKPERRRGGARRALEAREAYGVARVEAHPILMATFEQQEDARGDRAVE